MPAPFGTSAAVLPTLAPDSGAGTQAWLRAVAPVLDRLDQGIVLLQSASCLRYHNLAARRLLEGDAERDLLADAVRRVALAAVALDGGDSAEREVGTATAHYRLRAHPIRIGPAGAGVPCTMTMVVIDPLTLPLPRREALVRRFGLTPREADVGMLLAQGARNAAIARALALSPNTVRHYTERVMVKLGVHTRAAATRSLLALRASSARS